MSVGLTIRHAYYIAFTAGLDRLYYNFWGRGEGLGERFYNYPFLNLKYVIINILLESHMFFSVFTPLIKCDPY